MISLTLSRFPFVLLMLGFTNILCMSFIQSLGVVIAACSSVALTVAFFTAILIYNLWNGLSYRQILETKLTSNMSGAGCLIGIVFLVGGLVIMSTATDGKRNEAAIEGNGAKQMTKMNRFSSALHLRYWVPVLQRWQAWVAIDIRNNAEQQTDESGKKGPANFMMETHLAQLSRWKCPTDRSC